MDKLFSFHGVDHKVGVTMIAQSVAELIANERKDLKILLITLNGRKNAGYVKENIETIDNYRMQIDSKIIVSKDFLGSTKRYENLHMLAGLIKESDERYYFPDSAAYLLEAVEDQFDIIISDTGSEIDNGLAVGGLLLSNSNYLILTQLESSLRRFEEQADRFLKIDISFEKHIINKFEEKDPYTLQYIEKRLNLDKSELLKVKNVDYGKQAEMEYRSLIEFRDDKYKFDIGIIANQILFKMGENEIDSRKKIKWKNFT
jgi:cellulose biosynthesis protein BcsQ